MFDIVYMSAADINSLVWQVTWVYQVASPVRRMVWCWVFLSIKPTTSTPCQYLQVSGYIVKSTHDFLWT